MTKKLGVIILVITAFLFFLIWLFIASSKPLPGEKLMQDGRNHLAEGSKVEYKFNPPTSGDHYASWISKGFYNEPRPDGNMVHSMEHGYIIVWYNCDRKLTINNGQWTIFSNVYAQGVSMTQGSEGSASAHVSDMPKSFSDGSCETMKNQIKDVLKTSGPHKLIGMPRVGMDSPIVLTAWGRMEKLTGVDEKKIKEFIDAFRDAGPEATNEP